eukprot:3722722-Pyramimonas_sp.AAC.1
MNHVESARSQPDAGPPSTPPSFSNSIGPMPSTPTIDGQPARADQPTNAEQPNGADQPSDSWLFEMSPLRMDILAHHGRDS